MRRDKELTIEITSKCQLECKWCSANATPSGTHVPIEKIFVAMRSYTNWCNVLRLSGGEPTLHPQLSEILVEATKFLTFKVILMTNGQTVLPLSLRDRVEEFAVNYVNPESYHSILTYHDDHRNVSMHVVAVEGNEQNVLDALNLAYGRKIPCHVLALQKQGRGIECKPSTLITWSGERGCSRNRKITITHDGHYVTCSALKSGRTRCNLW